MQPAKKKEEKDQQFCIKNSYPPKYKAHLINQTWRRNKNVERIYS